MNPTVIGADVDACFAHFTRRIGDLALQSEANRTRVQNLGGSELLVALLQRASDDAVLEGAAVALSNIALTDSGRRGVRDAGGVKVLVRLLDPRIGAGVQAAAAGALRNLACWDEARRDIVDMGGVEGLLLLCDAQGHGELPAVQENAAAAIANLADDAACRARVAEIGGLEVLCSLCSTAQSDAVLACAAAAIGNLADDETNRVKIAEVGGLEPLVQLCAGSTDDTVLESAAAAIANLAYNESNRKRIAQLSGIEPLVWLCVHSKNEAVLESAAAAIGNLAYYNDLNRIRVAETGGLQALVHLCEATQSEAVLESASGALRHVIYNNDSNRMRFIKVGGLELLVRLCTTCESEAVLESATAVLRKTVSSAEIAQRLLDAGALGAMLKLEAEWTGTIKTYASQTLRALERKSRRAWFPPSGSLAKPTLAYMLLPAAHLSNMEPQLQKKAVCRRPAGSANPPQGGGAGGELATLLAECRSSLSPEEMTREMDNVQADLESVEAWLERRSGCSILGDRCIQAADASIVLENAGAVKAIREFFASDEVDLFFLAYSGSALLFPCRAVANVRVRGVRVAWSSLPHRPRLHPPPVAAIASHLSPLSAPWAFCGEQLLCDLAAAADLPHSVTCRTSMAADMWHSALTCGTDMWHTEQARNPERGVVLCRLHSVVRSGAAPPHTHGCVCSPRFLPCPSPSRRYTLGVCVRRRTG